MNARILIVFFMLCMPCIFLAAAEFDERYSRNPQFHQYIVTSSPGIPGAATPFEAIARGGIDGTQGGVGLLVKSLIIAIPTACYFAYSKVRDWYAGSGEGYVLKEEALVTSQTRLVLAHAKYAAAISNWVKARQQLEKDLQFINSNQESLQEGWKKMTMPPTVVVPVTPDQSA